MPTRTVVLFTDGEEPSPRYGANGFLNGSPRAADLGMVANFEALTMVAAQVIGNDVAITIGGERGHFELNVMIPVIAHNLLESIEILATGSRVFADSCVAGITADEERCRRNAESTAALATVLAPRIGYDKAAEVAKRSLKEDKTLREVVLEMGLMSAADLDVLLDFDAMTRPGVG